MNYPVTPANTEIEYNVCELVIPPEFSLDDNKLNVISISGSISTATTPKLSSCSTPDFSDKEIDYHAELQKYHAEVKKLRYKLINLDMQKRSIEEDYLYLTDEIEIKKKELERACVANESLVNELSQEKEQHLKSKIIAAISIVFSGILFANLK